MVPRREHTSKALRYGTRSQGISQFYLHTPRLSANGMNHACMFASQPKMVLITAPRKDGRLSWVGWLVTHRVKCPTPGIEPGHGHPSKYCIASICKSRRRRWWWWCRWTDQLLRSPSGRRLWLSTGSGRRRSSCGAVRHQRWTATRARGRDARRATALSGQTVCRPSPRTTVRRRQRADRAANQTADQVLGKDRACSGLRHTPFLEQQTIHLSIHLYIWLFVIASL